MSDPASTPADRVVAAWDATLEAHERLLEVFLEWIAENHEFSPKDRRKWLQWVADEGAAMAEFRRGQPFSEGGRS